MTFRIDKSTLESVRCFQSAEYQQRRTDVGESIKKKDYHQLEHQMETDGDYDNSHAQSGDDTDIYSDIVPKGNAGE